MTYRLRVTARAVADSWGVAVGDSMSQAIRAKIMKDHEAMLKTRAKGSN